MFRGGKEYNPKQIQDMLNLGAQNRAAPRPGQPIPPQNFGASRFLLPVAQIEFQLTGILEGLARDPWTVANDMRPLRCTGVALSVAVGLLEVCSILPSLIFRNVLMVCWMSRTRLPTVGHALCCSLEVLLPRDPEWLLGLH